MQPHPPVYHPTSTYPYPIVPGPGPQLGNILLELQPNQPNFQTPHFHGIPPGFVHGGIQSVSAHQTRGDHDDTITSPGPHDEQSIKASCCGFMRKTKRKTKRKFQEMTADKGDHIVRKVCHHHLGYLAGMKMSTSDSFGLNCYTIPLNSTSKFFLEQDKKGWAREYDKAQVIFNSPYGIIMRPMMLKTENILFGTSLVPWGDHSKMNIQTGEQLVNMLYGFDKTGDTQVYTFVLLPGVLKIASYSGLSFVGEFSSKHAVISKAATEILYAGDLFVLDNTLYVTNNSGTYRPKEENLKKVVDLLKHEFPGLRVKGLGIKDPHYKAVLKRTHTRQVGVVC